MCYFTNTISWMKTPVLTCILCIFMSWNIVNYYQFWTSISFGCFSITTTQTVVRLNAELNKSARQELDGSIRTWMRQVMEHRKESRCNMSGTNRCIRSVLISHIIAVRKANLRTFPGCGIFAKSNFWNWMPSSAGFRPRICN